MIPDFIPAPVAPAPVETEADRIKREEAAYYASIAATEAKWAAYAEQRAALAARPLTWSEQVAAHRSRCSGRGCETCSPSKYANW